MSYPISIPLRLVNGSFERYVINIDSDEIVERMQVIDNFETYVTDYNPMIQTEENVFLQQTITAAGRIYDFILDIPSKTITYYENNTFVASIAFTPNDNTNHVIVMIQYTYGSYPTEFHFVVTIPKDNRSRKALNYFLNSYDGVENIESKTFKSVNGDTENVMFHVKFSLDSNTFSGFINTRDKTFTVHCNLKIGRKNEKLISTPMYYVEPEQPPTIGGRKKYAFCVNSRRRKTVSKKQSRYRRKRRITTKTNRRRGRKSSTKWFSTRKRRRNGNRTL